MAKWVHVSGVSYIPLDRVTKVSPDNSTGSWRVQYQGDFGSVTGVNTYGSQADALAAIPLVLADSSNVVDG